MKHCLAHNFQYGIWALCNVRYSAQVSNKSYRAVISCFPYRTGPRLIIVVLLYLRTTPYISLRLQSSSFFAPYFRTQAFLNYKHSLWQSLLIRHCETLLTDHFGLYRQLNPLNPLYDLCQACDRYKVNQCSRMPTTPTTML